MLRLQTRPISCIRIVSIKGKSWIIYRGYRQHQHTHTFLPQNTQQQRITYGDSFICTWLLSSPLLYRTKRFTACGVETVVAVGRRVEPMAAFVLSYSRSETGAEHRQPVGLIGYQ